MDDGIELGGIPAEDGTLSPGSPRRPLDGPFGPDRPHLPLNWLRYPPVTVRILVVTDGDVTYGPEDFGLRTALTAVSDDTLPEHPSHVRFEFTKAHRLNAPGTSPGFKEFRFTDGSLDGFDEVWLFGFRNGSSPSDPTTPGPYLSEAELRVLSQFMQAGGGVFAAGDHEDLGLGLCGAVPRVRNMRKWWHRRPLTPLAPGEPNAPSAATTDRNDTVQPATPGGDPNDGSERDAVPQPIWPFWYRTYAMGHVRRYPHPTLCGPRGAIRVLPDHPHEGECVVPADLTKSLTFDEFTFDEYPAGVAPEVIAIAANVVGRDKDGIFEITEPRRFGVLGAYDGHRVVTDERPDGVGRVVVDSTWHHWFNMNVDGLAAEDGNEWRDILMYFRNVGFWLAPKPAQEKMRRAGTLMLRYTYPLIEDIPGPVASFDPDMIYAWGVSARDGLGKPAPQCQYYGFFLDWIRPWVSDPLFRLVDPWSPDALPREVAEDPAYARMADDVITSVFGGIVASVASDLPDARLMSERDLDDRLDDVVARGVRIGLAAAADRIGRYADALGAALGLLAVGTPPQPETYG